jgi:hypothetical protein
MLWLLCQNYLLLLLTRFSMTGSRFVTFFSCYILKGASNSAYDAVVKVDYVMWTNINRKFYFDLGKNAIAKQPSTCTKKMHVMWQLTGPLF